MIFNNANHYVYLVEVSIITRMGMDFAFFVERQSQMDMFGALNDFSLHYALFMILA